MRNVGTPREDLADLLRQSREDVGFGSQGALAKRLHVSRPTINRAENPIGPIPKDDLLTAWAGATGVPLDQLTDLAARARSGTPEWFMPYLGAESTATMIRCWSPMIVPGVLQTRAYAYEMLKVERYAPERLAELVNTRIQRQRVLDRARVVTVLDYSVTRRMLGSPQVMAEQCAHLVTVAEQPNVSMHIVPENTNTGIWCAIDIATRGAASTVCMTTLRDVTSTAADMIDDAMSAFDRVLGCALPLDQSIDFLRTEAERWKEQV